MKPFLHFSMELESKHSAAMAKDAYLKAISNNASCCIKNKGVKEQQIIFAAKNDSFLWHNSFLPVVELNFSDAEQGAKIIANFRLRWTVQILMYIIVAVALVFEIGILCAYIPGDAALLFPLLIPLILAVFAVLLSYIGLRLSSIPVKEFLEYVSP